MATTKRSKKNTRPGLVGVSLMSATAADMKLAAGRLAEVVAPIDHKRLLRLLALGSPGDHEADRAVGTEALFAGDDAAFRAFTSRLNKAAGGVLALRSTKADDGQPTVGFYMLDDPGQRFAGYSEATSDLPDNLVDNPAVPSDPLGKPALYFSVLHARGDEKLAKQLIEPLRTQLRASKKYAHDLWDQSKVLTGQDTEAEIEEALGRSDYVIVLLSPKFLTDDSLKHAPEIVARRRCVPVALGLLDERHALGAFTGTQVYPPNREVAWSTCRGTQQREAFVLELFRAIEAVVEDGERRIDVHQRRWQDHLREAADLPDCVLDSKVARTELRDVVGSVRRAAEPHSGLDMLLEWVDQVKAPHYACVLGEFGIGKTTLLKRLTLALLQRREEDPKAPLPIFLDLRTYMESIEGARGQRTPAKLPTVEVLLGELMARAWKHPGAPPEPAQLLRMVREEGAVVIVDGLDEKLVHLSDAQGTELIRMLWGILPPTLFRRPQAGKRPGRVVISCRSHVFPTLQKQNATFTGGLRDDVRAEDYLALVVLPFDEEKIREYLQAHLGGRVDDALRLIASVQNRQVLARRPLFPDWTRRRCGRLEKTPAREEPVRGVNLYDHMVAACVDRDEGKHTIRPEDKPRFMEAIAAAMWRDGAREWPWERVFDWLRAHIVGNPVLMAAYPLDSERTARIAEDFRTATMVLRPDRGDLFRFAHTSMQEYFLARWLFRALAEERPDDWMLPMPSDETLDFLGQLLVVRGGTRWQATLDGLLALHRPQATRIAFRYWLQACEHGHPQPCPMQVCLPGEDLAGWTIAGTDAAPLGLAGADLRGTNLRGASLSRVKLRGAALRGADVVCATLGKVDLQAGELAGADFTGSVWRDCWVDDSTGAAASWWDSEWIRTSPPPAVRSMDAARTTPAGWPVEIRGGHTGAVTACAFSPDGTSIVSASDDHTLKGWDARSGRLLLTLAGHTGSVNACAYSPDGTSIVSASEDRTLKVWDASKGRELLTLSGHRHSVKACAYSPDGKCIVSASHDKTLKVWDVRSRRALLTLSGHLHAVNACAYSPDGASIVSASDDGTLRVWDAQSGRVRLILSDHAHPVKACAYSPDGASIVSASDDETLKVWDARSGLARLTLPGHVDWVKACAYSPDGARIVSASDDETLKVWDARSGRVVLTLSAHTRWVNTCAYSPDCTRIVSASEDWTLKVWDARSGRLLLTLAGHAGSVNACAYSPDGASIVSASNGRTLKMWDVRSGRARLILSGPAGWVNACAYSPDGASIISASHGRTLKVWDARSGRMRLTLAGHARAVKACAYSPDSATIVSASHDKTLKVWDARTGVELLTLVGHAHVVMACAYSPDGASIISASHDRKLKVWDARSGLVLLTLAGHTRAVNACAYSPDGANIVSASQDGTLKVWDARSGRALITLAGHAASVKACAYSPDGASIVSASYDNTLKVWDARSGDLLHTLSGHAGSVNACAYSPDGSSIVSASGDGTTRIWDAASGRLLRTLWQFEDVAATIDETTRRVLWATPNAWRYLCYRGFDPERGAYRVYPIEASGPLPT